MNKEQILSRVHDYVKQRTEPKKFVPTVDDVPVSGAVFSAIDITRLVDVALDGWVTEGKQADLFAKKLAKFTGIPRVTLCNSGSSASLLAVTALIDLYGTPRNSLIVTSALAFPTTVAPIMQNGMIPLFVDADISTLNPSTNKLIELANNPKVGGIILAHTLGFPYDEKTVVEAFGEAGKWVISDVCDSLGSTIAGVHVGNYADAATLSFFPAHHVSAGEGGAVLCKHWKLHELINSYARWGRSCNCSPGEDNRCGKRFTQEFPNLPVGFDHKYTFSKIGYNLKITDLQSALGSSQMDRIADIVNARKNNFAYLKMKLEKISLFKEYFQTVYVPVGMSSSPFGFPITIKKKIHRAEIVSFLEERKIRTRPIFAGNITRHPMMEHINYMTDGSLVGCDYIMENSWWLGIHPEINKDQLDYVVQSFEEFLRA